MEHIHSWCEVYLHSTASLLRKQFEIVSVASDAVVVNDSSLAKLIEASLGVIQEQALACLGLDGNWLDP
jgi:Ni2+-binding GTPase involved in maturation of urease and hydrogenase